jgi:glycosyl transferase family 25
MSNQPKISALVINLDSAKERWKFQQEQLEYLDIPYQRWKATAVQDLTDREYEKWANDWQRKLRKTEVACFLSHYRAWQHVANSEKPFLILEDDALLSQQLPNILSLLDTEQNLEYDHLTLETRGRKKLISQNTCDNFESVAMHKLFLDKTGAAAYLLTSNGAQILIDEVEKKGAGLADALLCHTKGLKKVQSVPALAIQMDMAEHYGLDGLKLNSAAKSNISTLSSSKPNPNRLSDKLVFRSRRLTAQLNMGFIQAKYSSQSKYLEIAPKKSDFVYLNTLLKY